ncbi:hypothetical protein AB834_06220 [PVC group bacterium (ex Bugula neritina AB1)]|nr:hypothetical protein AB834_06220 [PVC group bacterium (ex Bugula neritina AB1)]
MSLIVYGYKKCSTCQKAYAYLKEKGVFFEERPIRETPPSLEELRLMLMAVGNIKKLLNVSGVDYRKMDLKSKIPNMTEDAILELLMSCGNLIKRPFAIDGTKGITGFKPEEWEKLWG